MWTDEQDQPIQLTKTRIAIIGPEAFMPKLLPCLEEFPLLEPVLLGYEQETEAPQLARQAANDADVLLFTGPYPYELAKNELQLQVPSLYIPQTGSGLYGSLLQMEIKYGLTALSIDSLGKDLVESMLEELDEPDLKLTLFEGDYRATKEELLQFHREQYRTGRARCALTALGSVAKQLREEGVPCNWLLPSKQDIAVTLERAMLAAESQRSKESQIVMGLIHIDNFVQLADSQKSEHVVQRLKLEIHHLVLNFVEHLDGHLTQLAINKFSFVTTRGIFERATKGYKEISLAKKAKRKFDLQISMGIGFGQSANEAGKHANHSLRLARDGGGNICFIVGDEGSVIGPLEVSEQRDNEFVVIDPALQKKAESAGMTSLYLSKLVTHMTRFGKSDYYAQELADALGVTLRSVHRFLLMWMDAGLVDIIGEEKGASRGRPKLKYRISFLSDLIP